MPKTDRNYLILPALEIIQNLCPKIVIIENVAGMSRTEIEIDGKYNLILDVINSKLENYVCKIPGC